MKPLPYKCIEYGLTSNQAKRIVDLIEELVPGDVSFERRKIFMEHIIVILKQPFEVEFITKNATNETQIINGFDAFNEERINRNKGIHDNMPVRLRIAGEELYSACNNLNGAEDFLHEYKDYDLTSFVDNFRYAENKIKSLRNIIDPGPLRNAWRDIKSLLGIKLI